MAKVNKWPKNRKASTRPFQASWPALTEESEYDAVKSFG